MLWEGDGSAAQPFPEQNSDPPSTAALESLKKITIQRKLHKRGIYTLWKFKKSQTTSLGFNRITHLAAAIILEGLAQEKKKKKSN